MHISLRSLQYLGVCLFAIIGSHWLAIPQAQAQTPICFPNVAGINDCIGADFVGYWRDNGGLAVFGYPIGPVQEVNVEGATLTAQWFERARLELHPNNPAEYRVLMGRMGAERMGQLGRSPQAEPRESGPQPGCRWFPETGFNVCDSGDRLGFKTYWESNGLKIAGLNNYQRSLALFGYPVSSPKVERNADGAEVLTQWFERARFEWHPSNPDQFKVLLGLLGRETRDNIAPITKMRPVAAMGVEINQNQVRGVASLINPAQIQWVRYNGINWNTIESTQGVYNWASASTIDADLSTISAQGAQAMVIIRGTPSWARASATSACGPIKPEALGAFANFVGETVRRYSQAPYNVKYWELGNEVDADVSLVGGDAPYGCWGDTRKPYHGGEEYAAMLKVAYTAIKTADPNAQVLLGGLLLDCDPDRATSDKPCANGKFFEGILRAGGAEAFDIVAYHSYFYWGPFEYDLDVTRDSWVHRGGSTIGKLQFLRELMSRYNVQKPILMNEGALLCFRSDPRCGPQGYYTAQAEYLVRFFTRASGYDVIGSIWYTLNGPGWQDAGLTDARQQPRPAYQSLKLLNQLLSNGYYVANHTQGTLEAYEFRTQDGRGVMIGWTNDGAPATLNIPGTISNVTDHQGNRINSATTSVELGSQSRIVYFTPKGN